MQITDATSKMLENYLDLAAAQLKLTAGNMANIDTPGFKTLGFDFEQAMNLSMDNQIASNGMPASFRTRRIPGNQVEGLISRPDGNNVSVDRESMKMADAQLKFKTGIAFLKADFAQISEAIHSDSK